MSDNAYTAIRHLPKLGLSVQLDRQSEDSVAVIRSGARTTHPMRDIVAAVYQEDESLAAIYGEIKDAAESLMRERDEINLAERARRAEEVREDLAAIERGDPMRFLSGTPNGGYRVLRSKHEEFDAVPCDHEPGEHSDTYVYRSGLSLKIEHEGEEFFTVAQHVCGRRTYPLNPIWSPHDRPRRTASALR